LIRRFFLDNCLPYGHNIMQMDRDRMRDVISQKVGLVKQNVLTTIIDEEKKIEIKDQGGGDEMWAGRSILEKTRLFKRRKTVAALNFSSEELQQ